MVGEGRGGGVKSQNLGHFLMDSVIVEQQILFRISFLSL